MRDVVKKEEIEQLIGCGITDEQFNEAFEYAKRKRDYIYKQEYRLIVLKHWYLVKLTEEYVRSLAFSKFTMDLCRNLRDMEKERPVKKPKRPTDNHIIALSVL